MNKNNPPVERLEEIINWTLPGLTMYYRDSNLEPDVIKKYEVGMIFRSGTFVDVSNYAGKPITNCRFIFASSKAAPMFKVNPETQKWGFHAINYNSYFKVLDVYEYQEITQVFLLHIPFKGIDLFKRTVLKLGEQNIEEQIITKARESLHQKMQKESPPALLEKAWLDRTNFPIGLDHKNEFFSLLPSGPLQPMARPLFTGIKKMTGDTSDLNTPEMDATPPPEANAKSDNQAPSQPKSKGGFWSNLFGKK